MKSTLPTFLEIIKELFCRHNFELKSHSAIVTCWICKKCGYFKTRDNRDIDNFRKR